MKILRITTFLILFSLLVACGKPAGIALPAPPPSTPEDNSTPSDPSDPSTPGDPDDPEIPADAILVTNSYMEKYLEEVHYTEGDFSVSYILDYPGGGPGEADIPPSIELKWPDTVTGAVKLHLIEGDGQWTRDYTLASGAKSLKVSSLVPNQKYVYTLLDSQGEELARETFYTKGHLHQIYFPTKMRNGRDLGGWKTYDGRKVKYRKLFRGGKPSDGYINAEGKEEALAQGIRAQLILRSNTDSETKNPPFGDDVVRFGPGFENGYSDMLKETDKVKQCFWFVLNQLKADKPVFFHCSIGSDRTGTMSMLFLGALGVPEPDVCKDYELSYFAPEDWSMTNGKCTRVRTYENRYLNAINYFLKFGPENGNFRDHVEAYLLAIGVSTQDIEDFRDLMLE